MDMIKMLAAALLVCFALFGGVFVVSSVAEMGLELEKEA